jgi:predicted TIM-barrel fold metal-dependent hydrolase
LRIDHFFTWFNIKDFSQRADITVDNLQDWYKVIDHFFEKYGPYAVGVKSAAAYSRNIDYEKVPADIAEPLFRQLLSEEKLTYEKQKMLEDHLFWYSVEKSTEYHLPVKLHTGYYAGYNGMPLSKVAGNATAAADLCRQAPDTQFVFFHIDYPYYEDMLAVAKQYTNAVIDMCWSWIINPVGSKDFLKKFLVTVPANKVLTFGGDYIPVEPVLGHAIMARKGIALALSELVEEQWISLDDALELTDGIMHGNARTIYDLTAKTDFLKSHSWK